MNGCKVDSLSISLGLTPIVDSRIEVYFQTILEIVNVAQVFPQIYDQIQFNGAVVALKENIQMFNFYADVYELNTKSKLPGDLINSECFQIRHDMNNNLHNALKNMDIANELLREKLISNEYGLFNEHSIERWADIHNKNAEAFNLLWEQRRIHIDNENDLRDIRRHLVNFVPIDQQQRTGTSLLNERNFVYLDFKNTQKTRKLFRYIVTRLKSVNKLVNVVNNNPNNNN